MILVYLECRSDEAEGAKQGAASVLKMVAGEWFNHPKLMIEDKYATLLS